MRLDEAVRLIQTRWPGAVSLSEAEPVFLLAAGWRSGSTMLQRMLLQNCLVWGEPYGSSGLIERLAQPLQRFMPNWPQEEFFLGGQHDNHPLGEQWTANLYPPVQSLLNAHVQFFLTLFGEPSRAAGFKRWGMKEVRYGIEHAVYLHWLFPKAKFLFLIRNPYKCWESYRRAGSRVMRYWPEKLITTPEPFAIHWLNLAEGFCNRFSEVDGLLVQHESLADPRFDLSTLEAYLGFDLDPIARKVMVGASPPGVAPPGEMDLIHEIVSPLANHLGYEYPH